MAEVKGMNIKLGLDYKEFDKGIADVTSSLKEQGRQLKSVNEQIKYNPKNVDLWKKKQSILNTTIRDTKKRLEESNKKLKAMNANTKGISDAEFKSVEKAIEKDTQALEKLNSQLDNTQLKIRQVTTQNFAKIESLGRSLTNSITKPVAGAVTALGGLSIALAYNTDKLADNAAKVGLTAEEYQKWNYAGEIMAVSTSTLQRMFIKVNDILGDIATGNSLEAAQSLHQIGLTIDDIKGLNAGEALMVIADALKDIEDPAKKAAMLSEFFGEKIGSELLPLVNLGSQGISELFGKAEELGIATNEQAALAGQVTDKITDLKMAFNGLALELQDSILPLFMKLMDYITDTVVPKLKELIDYWNNLDGRIKGIILTIGGIITALGPVLLIFGTFGKTLGGLSEGVGALKEGFTILGGAFKAIVGAMSPMTIALSALAILFGTLYATNEEFRESVNDLLKSLLELVGDIIKSVKPVFDEFVVLVKDLLKVVLDVTGSIFKSMMPVLDTLIDIIKALFNAAKPILELVTSLFALKISYFLDITKDAIKALETPIKMVVEFIGTILSLISDLVKLVTPFIATITEKIKGLWDIVKPFVDKIKELTSSVLVNFIEDLTDKFRKFTEPLKSVADLFGSLFGKKTEVNANVSTTNDGVGGLFGNIASSIGGFFGNLLGQGKASTTNNSSNTVNNVSVYTSSSVFDIDSINRALGGLFV